MYKEFELDSEIQLGQVNTLTACVSNYEVLSVPILKIIQVPGPAEMLSIQSDEYMCLDSDSEQENKASRPTANNLLSNPK